MNIAVLGLWHLGCVTAACLAKNSYNVIGVDFDAELVHNLQLGKPPIFEPGLEELIVEGLQNKKIKFSTDCAELSDADLIWVAYDTPVDENDIADVSFVVKQLEKSLPAAKKGAIIIISSQLPIGTISKLERHAKDKFSDKQLKFVSWPENLRLGSALSAFNNSDRVVIGTREDSTFDLLEPLARELSNNVIKVSIESAEMSKHALNAFLATCIIFSNELACLCEKLGADSSEIERALRGDPRVGQKAYIRAGGPFAGGTLARDVKFLEALGSETEISIPLIRSILESNQSHGQWVQRRLLGLLNGHTNPKNVAVLGLAYKSGTDTLRRSRSLDLLRWLVKQDVSVSVFDPKVKTVPIELNGQITTCHSIKDAIRNVDIVILQTPWPEFKELTNKTFKAFCPDAIIIDQDRILEREGSDPIQNPLIQVGVPK